LEKSRRNTQKNILQNARIMNLLHSNKDRSYKKNLQ